MLLSDEQFALDPLCDPTVTDMIVVSGEFVSMHVLHCATNGENASWQKTDITSPLS